MTATKQNQDSKQNMHAVNHCAAACRPGELPPPISSPSDGERLWFRLHRSDGPIIDYWLHRGWGKRHDCGSLAGPLVAPAASRRGQGTQVSPFFAGNGTADGAAVTLRGTAAFLFPAAAHAFVARPFSVLGIYHPVHLVLRAEPPLLGATIYTK